ncbi:MAG: MFS sugar transporter [Trichoglossum hirsutum]|nr:MAG: MFS sugar transporter [Trichoglossum hirsutum]
MTTLTVPDSDDSKNITMDEKDASVPATATSQATTLAVDKESDVRTEVGTETSRSTKEDEEEYPSGIKLLIISIALCLAVFLVALDNTIIATAIPKITDHFKALDDVGWYGSSYLLCTCAFQLLFGKIYTFYSVKWTFLTAIFIFELGSLVCGAAPTSNALIIGRAVAGLGCAGIFSGALIIVAHSVPLHQRPIYTGAIGAMYGVASVAGPLMGGAFTDHLSWRWCFYINLPIGAATMAAIAFFFKGPKSSKEDLSLQQRFKLLDLWGTLVFMPAIVCLLLALQWGGSKYAWKSAQVIVLLVVFFVLICAFIVIQLWKQENATLPPRILRQRSVASGAWYASCTGAALLLAVFYLPIWFQAIKGVSATKSGIMNLPLILSLVTASLLAGGSVTALGYYTPFMIAGSILMAIGGGLISTFRTNTGHSMWIGYQVVFGFGVGMGMQQPLMAVQAVLDITDVPIGTSIIVFAQTLGAALFISVGQNVLTNRLVSGLLEAVPSLDPSIVLQTGATSLKAAIDPQYLSGVLFAYNRALDQTFYVITAMACLSIIGALGTEWRSIKEKKVVAPATA